MNIFMMKAEDLERILRLKTMWMDLDMKEKV